MNKQVFFITILAATAIMHGSEHSHALTTEITKLQAAEARTNELQKRLKALQEKNNVTTTVESSGSFWTKALAITAFVGGVTAYFATRTQTSTDNASTNNALSAIPARLLSRNGQAGEIMLANNIAGNVHVPNVELINNKKDRQQREQIQKEYKEHENQLKRQAEAQKRLQEEADAQRQRRGKRFEQGHEEMLRKEQERKAAEQREERRPKNVW
jgi:hypothetical protein